MIGRIKRNQAVIQEPFCLPAEVVCPLCLRLIPQSQQDAHHLVPKSRGGVATVLLHRLCHRQIHALLTETQLARHYPSIEALSAHPEIIKFIDWVKDKPADLNATIRRSRDKGRL
ncbi:HNH endonuclease [Polynucleobacter brandtiae]|uniref:HNH endonuclease n=1 Tax=Polynucleobacter brandtiae TaxID=1938816 RepID=A0A2M8VZT4_9BURK|nr:HNH endonuclease [Polynucleobacter brandtiae]PJI83370.1 hypothetical protein B0G85_0767 [Polynucleobacter brandtiae]